MNIHAEKQIRCLFETAASLLNGRAIFPQIAAADNPARIIIASENSMGIHPKIKADNACVSYRSHQLMKRFRFPVGEHHSRYEIFPFLL